MLEVLGIWLKMFWAYLKPGFILNHYQEGILLTNGKYAGTFGPGFYFKWPFWEFVYEVNIMPDTLNIPPIPLTTKDNETIVLGLMIDYHIEPMQNISKKDRILGWRIMETGSKKFMIENNNALSNLSDRCQGEMSDLIEGLGWEDIRKQSTRTKLQKLLQAYAGDLGIVIDEVKFTSKAKSQVMFMSGDKHAEVAIMNQASI